MHVLMARTELEDAHSDASTLQEALREARRANTQLVEERDSTYEKHVTEVKSRLGQIGGMCLLSRRSNYPSPLYSL